MFRCRRASGGHFPPVAKVESCPAVAKRPGPVSFVGGFRGEKGRRQALLWHYPHFSRSTMGFPSRAIRRGGWKLIAWRGQSTGNGGNRVELFNLGEDLGEQNYVAGHLPAIWDSLWEALVSWCKETEAARPWCALRDTSAAPSANGNPGPADSHPPGPGHPNDQMRRIRS